MFCRLVLIYNKILIEVCLSSLLLFLEQKIQFDRELVRLSLSEIYYRYVMDDNADCLRKPFCQVIALKYFM